jgi:hypothetical protein
MNIPEQYLIKDPTKLVKGQKLWSAQFGEVEFEENQSYAIITTTDNGITRRFSLGGIRDTTTDHLPTLFLSSPFESQERVILVYDYITKKWVNRVLIKFTDNLAVCWDGAQTLESAKNKVSVSYWATWKELEPQEEIPEYTMEEIAVKLGHNFKIKK